jgi:hypothetical protein
LGPDLRNQEENCRRIVDGPRPVLAPESCPGDSDVDSFFFRARRLHLANLETADRSILEIREEGPGEGPVTLNVSRSEQSVEDGRSQSIHVCSDQSVRHEVEDERNVEGGGGGVAGPSLERFVAKASPPLPPTAAAADRSRPAQAEDDRTRAAIRNTSARSLGLDRCSV